MRTNNRRFDKLTYPTVTNPAKQIDSNSSS